MTHPVFLLTFINIGVVEIKNRVILNIYNLYLRRRV